MSSQFTIYRSTDPSAPVLTGSSGALLGVLDAVLVNGYGTKTAAGWSKPVANASNIGSYKQGAGALLSLVINDASPNATSLGKEAWATGWESVAGVGSPVGSGTNQFPTAAQLLTSGHVVIRKSTTNDNTNARAWIVIADASTFYLFVLTADTASTYYCFGYGDIYSFAGSGDAYRVAIIGNNAENTSAAANHGFDLMASALSGAVVGHYMARSFAPVSTSITVGKHGDAVKGNSSTFLGFVQYPNGTDNELYLSPVWMIENGTSTIRGLMRGIYQPCHGAGNFSDGQTFSGTGAYAGKTFMAIKQTPDGGVVFVETSNTVLTN